MGQIGYFFNIIFTFPIFNALMLLDHLFGDLGLSIIVLTLIIRLCLFPLTLKQLRSTKATQAIQPLIADIRKKYANDQQTQYREMQRLYKEYNINPMSGCLPLLVQLPILYGLYGAMNVVLRPGHPLQLADINNVIYPFLPRFSAIPNFDLRWFTFVDPHWSLSLAATDPTHVLPVLAALATFVQLRMSQARNRPQAGKSDMMTQQMQIMSFVMPFVTLFIALSFPAGLALYWTTTSIFSMVQQYFVTGWGSLFSLPTLGGGRPKNEDRSGAYVGDGRKERTALEKTVDAQTETRPERANSARTNGYSAGSSARRRRPNSSSARRRGAAPSRRNPSRS